MAAMSQTSLLQDTAKLYRSLSRTDYLIILKDDTVLELRFPTQCYHHLIGLHKFTDIAKVTIDKSVGRSANSIFQDILRGNISEYDLQYSQHYEPALISDRLHAFLGLKDVLSPEASLIFPFDREALSFNSKIRGDLLLFRNTLELSVGTLYVYLFFRLDPKKGYYVPISFFELLGDSYTKNQHIKSIKEFRVMNRDTK